MKPTPPERWKLTLVLLSDDELSAIARENIEDICRKELNGCRIEMVDAAADLDFLKKHQLFAIPTLIRESPAPIKKIIGSLTNRQIVLKELGITAGTVRSP